MSAQTIDYDALAQQHGGSAAVDYDALAAQHGGSAAAETEKTAQPSLLHRLASNPNNIPLDSYAHATERGFANIGQGVAQTAEAVAHPIDIAKSLWGALKGYGSALAGNEDAANNIVNSVKQPFSSPLALGDAAGRGAGQIIAGLGTDAALGAAKEVVSPLAQAAAERATTAAQTALSKVTPAKLAKMGGEAAGGVIGGATMGKLGAAAGVYAGSKLGKVAELVLGKDRANSPLFGRPDLSLDDITDALVDTIAQDRQRFTEQQASGLGKLPQTGARPASVTGEALAGKPVSGGLPEPPTTGGKAAPRFTVADRAAAKSLLQDALSQSTKDIVDQALPDKIDPATKLRAQSQVDLALQQGDIAKAEAVIKQANPAWTPKDRLPVPSVDEIRGRIQAQVQTPQGFSDTSEDNQILDSMRYDLNRHGWSAESEARREFIARNSTGMTKGELGQQAGMVGAEPKPVKLTKTPGVNTNAGTPATDDLTNLLQQSLDAVKKRQQQK